MIFGRPLQTDLRGADVFTGAIEADRKSRICAIAVCVHMDENSPVPILDHLFYLPPAPGRDLEGFLVEHPLLDPLVGVYCSL